MSESPDYFGFYSREVTELFTELEDDVTVIPSSELPGISGRKRDRVTSAAPLFSNFIGSQLSEFGKERLKALVRESLLTFRKEADSIASSVFGICRMESIFRYKESLLKLEDLAKDASEDHRLQKKQKVLASISMDDDLRLLLDSTSSKVEPVLEKHKALLLAKIEDMLQSLDAYLNLLNSNSRVMTLTEKQKLQKLIQGLPQKNLSRVVDILQHGRPTEEIHVDLEKQSKATLWRLYVFVEAVKNARELCQV